MILPDHFPESIQAIYRQRIANLPVGRVEHAVRDICACHKVAVLCLKKSRHALPISQLLVSPIV